jgi:hypothetical protein
MCTTAAQADKSKQFVTFPVLTSPANDFKTEFKKLTFLANTSKTKKLNSVAWFRERTIPTERPTLIGEVGANLCG